MLRMTSLLLVGFVAAVFGQGATNDESQVWNLEKAYWEYVKANDLEKYRALWHENFLGWPFVDSAPVRKDHITDWISMNTSKGMKLQSYSIEHVAIQITGDIAVTQYRITMNWAKDQRPETKNNTMRITHTWIRTDGTWQIIGGMSAPVNPDGK
jgi:Domain of unknown function (DUF4440)